MAYGFRFSEEHYRCSDCDKWFEDDSSFRKDWKCPDCENDITIYTKNGSRTNERQAVVKRLFANEIEEDDLVLLLGSTEHHRVLDKKYKNGKYSLAIEGHGVIKLSSNDWINCIWGGWSGEKEDLS